MTSEFESLVDLWLIIDDLSRVDLPHNGRLEVRMAQGGGGWVNP